MLVSLPTQDPIKVIGKERMGGGIKFCNNQVSREKPSLSYFSAFLGMKVEDRVATDGIEYRY